MYIYCINMYMTRVEMARDTQMDETHTCGTDTYMLKRHRHTHLQDTQKSLSCLLHFFTKTDGFQKSPRTCHRQS